MPLLVDESSQAGEARMPAASGRVASSLARSRERREIAAHVLAAGLRQLIARWIEHREFERMMCAELLFVLGWGNKEVASHLGITEQAVANHKHFVVSKLREHVAASALRDFDAGLWGL